MQDLAETLLAQHLAYSFLSKVFYEAPTTEFIQPNTNRIFYSVFG